MSAEQLQKYKAQRHPVTFKRYFIEDDKFEKIHADLSVPQSHYK